MDPVIVIAGNNREYMHWIQTNGIVAIPHWQRRYIYIGDGHTVRGIRDPSFVFVGTYEQRPDWQRLADMLSMYRDFPSRLQNQIQVVIEKPCPYTHIDLVLNEELESKTLAKEEYGYPNL